jgi:hypothetical protein
MSHTCHAPDCKRLVPARMFACPWHWAQLPGKIQDAIWNEYREGQEISKRVSWRYAAVQRLACAYLVFEPHSEAAVLKAFPYLAEAVRYSKEAIKDGQGDPLEGLIPKEWPTMPVVKARGKAKTL